VPVGSFASANYCVKLAFHSATVLLIDEAMSSRRTKTRQFESLRHLFNSYRGRALTPNASTPGVRRPRRRFGQRLPGAHQGVVASPENHHYSFLDFSLARLL